MNLESGAVKGNTYLARGWHPMDAEGYSPYICASKEKELLAARETAWIGVFLMATGRQDLVGADAHKVLNNIFVNRDFSKLKIGGSRHAIRCNEKGQIMDSGVVIRVSEDRFCTYGMCPGFYGYFSNIDMDVRLEFIDEYFIQIDGPKSLEIMEEASKSDIHDIKFAQNKRIKIEGKEVFIHRLGMSGSLAYEIHGPLEDVDIVLDAVLEAGKKYGAQQQGIRTYMSNHTTGGYPNQFIHFSYPDLETGKSVLGLELTGSAADDENNYFVTPYDVDWGGRVNFDHDFPGKEVLLRLSEAPPRCPVTLEWNLEDVMNIYKGEIDGTGVASKECIFDYDEMLPEYRRVHADKVMADGTFIGVASGRVRDFYHKSFISLAFIDKAYAKEGTELTVMWGNPGEPQAKIRAKVARFPYYNGEFRNETCDVNELIPKKY